MSWFTKWSFKNKAAVTILSLFVLVMGIVSYMKLPMEFLPEADQPFITVVVVGQGMDSDSMEKQVTTPIEKSLSSLDGKRNILSTTGDGFTKIDIHLEPKTDIKEAKQSVSDAINTLTLPPTVMKPNIVQLNTSMIPLSYVAVSFDDGVTPSNLKFAEEEVVPYFKDIKGVADIQTFGSVPSYVSVTLNEEKMNEKQIPLQNVMNVLQGQNLTTSIGETTIDGKNSNLKVIGDVSNIDQLKNIQVAPSITLADISSLEVKKPEGNMTRVNGKDGLLLIVTKDGNSNAVAISHEVQAQVKAVNKEFDNVETNIILSTADMVETSVQSMMKEVLLGALFATIVIMVFLRNLKSTLITIVSIPLSLGFTLFLLSKSGVTLNILTLGGVAVAVGRLVDDSIVVIENIFRKSQKEKLTVSLVIEATKEVGSAITSSTLTTVAVFLPMGLLNGSLQEFLLPFALTITYSLLASLLVALTVVPLMSAGLLKNAKLKEHKPSVRFSNFLTWSLNHKWIVILVALFMFAGSIGMYVALPKGAIDNGNADFVDVTLTYPNETPLSEVREGTLKLEKAILEQNGIKYTYTQLGNTEDSTKYGNVTSSTQSYVMTILEEDTDVDAFIKTMEAKKGEYGEGELNASAGTLMGGYQTSITIDVLGEDLEQLANVADNVKNEIKNIKGIESVSTNQEEKKSVYNIVVDPSESKAETVAQQMAVMLNPTPIGAITIEEQPAKVIVEPLMNPKSETEINDIPIMTEKGIVLVSNVAKLEKEEKPTSVFHKDGEQYIRVTAIVDPSELSIIAGEINKEIFGEMPGGKNAMDLPKYVEVIVGGASVDQASDFNALFMTMLASIGIVFLIMVITFKTVRAPIAILCSLPLAAIGAILGLLISGITVDITAMLGALMLIGIVVTNAIVLLDRVKQNELSMIIRDALVEAATTRMRPILMTAVATICAMLPLLFKEAESGNLVSASLAIVVIGGLSVATLLTLVVIPVVYELLYFKKSKKQRKKSNTDSALSA
ncbi:efflux RND transporter permease subunit [Bacillus suaedaesalsae]|uniref:Efflux RND transporter permease subunit n=1 Tax=Bacillus suaedaesalsae TaxID=2810349 RepID=A0ABS2DEZ4_9BACI|nr:efflux RND transporter permease subunit [Bacillus suaedaesalsae]MBM6617031.1 efflux RND transporter permease subunit [Bacillus suaedaesalsae]